MQLKDLLCKSVSEMKFVSLLLLCRYVLTVGCSYAHNYALHLTEKAAFDFTQDDIAT